MRIRQHMCRRLLLALEVALATCAPVLGLPTLAIAQEVVPAGELGVVVDVGDATLSAIAIREAIGVELGVEVAAEARQEGTLTVRILSRETPGEPLQASVMFRGEKGRTIERTISLPEDEAQSIEVIALLSGNLVRNEAGTLLLSLRRRTAAAKVEEPVVPEPTAPPTVAPAVEAPPAAEPASAVASWSPSRSVLLNLSLFHPISLYRPSEALAAGAELGLFYSRVGQVDAVGFNLLVLRVEHDLAGFGYGSLFASSGGSLDGFQLSGLASHVGESLEGAQVGGLATIAQGDADGSQVAGVFAYAGGSMDGVQLAGASSAAAGPVDGVQVSGALNVAWGGFDGVQLAAINVAADGEGVQLGAVNVARDFSGVQLAGVNVGRRVRGLQLGLINIAEDFEGFPIGLVNLSKTIRVQPTFWSSTTTVANAGVMYRARPGYTLLAMGWDPSSGPDQLQLGAAIGGSIPYRSLFLDVDVGYWGEWDGDLFGEVDRHVIRYRATVGVRPVGGVAILAGGGARQDIELGPDITVRPEFHVGMQLF